MKLFQLYNLMLMRKFIKIVFVVTMVVSLGILRYVKIHHKRYSEAKESLSKVYELEMAYKEMFGHYTDNLYALVFIQDTLVTEGGKANYQISLLEVTDTTFIATAISVVDFDKDGQFNTWTVNETGIITEIIED